MLRHPLASFALLVGASCSFAGASAVPNAADDPRAIVAELEGSAFTGSAPRAVQAVRLEAGAATIELESGSVWPVSIAAGAVREWVFVGRGRISLEPPDEIEAGQLELFTDERTLDREFGRAILVTADGGAALASGDESSTGDESRALASDLVDRWRASAERRRLGVEVNLAAAALGDPLFAGYFAAWIVEEEQTPYFFVVDPSEPEPQTLAHFEPLDASERDRRKIEKSIRRQQSEGRFLGRRFEDLGHLDVWVSAPLGDDAGEPRPGRLPFAPLSYVVDLEIDDRREELSGTTAVELRSTGDGARVALFELHPDLKVESVRAAGGELRWVRSGNLLLVALAEPAPSGATLRVEIGFGGRLLVRDDQRLVLADPVLWHPRAGDLERAAYDVTLTWPAALELVAGGRRTDGGIRADGRKWERRVVQAPSLGFGFEVGRYRSERFRVGEIDVVLAFDPDGRRLDKRAKKQIRDSVRSALEYFTETFGPPGIDELVVATTPRFFSQSLPGFVTLSSVMMNDFGGYAALFGIEDRRSVVAHEIAHQWWGHRVGWRSYRDQWISEGLAQYSAMAWARARLPADERPRVGPTYGWRSVLGGTTKDGRTIESLGPIVLGSRLASSKAATAYLPIVYKKGAIVLDMLANTVGPESFLRFLRSLVESAGGTAISTAELLAAIERWHGSSLSVLTDRFVYGTGVPEFLYDYRLAAEGGKWVVEGSARQIATHRTLFALESDDRGELRVAQRGAARTDSGSDAIVAPFQVGIWVPGAADEKERRRVERGGDPEANQTIKGRMVLDGETTPFRIEIDQQPVRLWLDLRDEAFATFYDAGRWPKRAAYQRARELERRRELSEAEGALREALAAPYADESVEMTDTRRRYQTRRFDARIRLLLVELALDRGDLSAAEAELGAFDRELDRSTRHAFRSWHALVEGRIALARARPEEAYRKLRKVRFDSAEANLYLALAAKATSRDDEFRKAIEAARRRGAEVGAAGLPAAKTIR